VGRPIFLGMKELPRISTKIRGPLEMLQRDGGINCHRTELGKRQRNGDFRKGPVGRGGYGSLGGFTAALCRTMSFEFGYVR
jgi:hypothetical protein